MDEDGMRGGTDPKLDAWWASLRARMTEATTVDDSSPAPELCVCGTDLTYPCLVHSHIGVALSRIGR